MARGFGSLRGIAVLAIVIGGVSLAGCDRGPRLEAPDKFKTEARALSTGQFSKVSDEVFLFAMGAAGDVLETCTSVELDPQARAELAPFVAAATLQASTGNGYDYGRNDLDDLPDGTRDQLASQSAYFAGAVAARQLKCDPKDTRVVLEHARSLADLIVNGRDGKGGPFLSSCSPVHGAEACKCLGMVGLSTDTNIFMSTYSRDTIASIIATNPMAGLAIALQCQIMNY